jgi:hypothetical protein
MKLKLLPILVLLSMKVLAQNSCESTTSADNYWHNSSSWSCGASVTELPNSFWFDGDTIIINTDITIRNSDPIDLRSSDVKVVIVNSGHSISFQSNAYLKLPANTSLILQDGAQLIALDNASSKLVEIGGNGVWGKGAGASCNNNTVTGGGTITENSDCLQPLPVVYKEIDIIHLNDNKLLHWETFLEINNSHFVIQAEKDSTGFVDIGVVSAESDQEYYFNINNYKNYDFFRIKQVDNDGTYEYSKLISNVHSNELSFLVFPNPTGDGDIQVITPRSDFYYTFIFLYSSLGELLNSKKSKNTKHNFHLTTSGGFYIKVIQGNKSSINKVNKI